MALFDSSRLRAQEGTLNQLDDTMVAYHFDEPLGVVGQIIPWNFPQGAYQESSCICAAC